MKNSGLEKPLFKFPRCQLNKKKAVVPIKQGRDLARLEQSADILFKSWKE
jgi:hypothetical protein